MSSAVVGAVKFVPTYWWDQDLNFGDQLTPALLPRLGVAPVHQLPRHSALVGVGSIIEHLPSDYRGALWGSGLMFDRRARLPGASVSAVRGYLTAEHLGLDSAVPTGDPGLLLQAPASRERTHPVLLPHFRHREDPLWGRLARHLGPTARLVDVRQRPAIIAREVAEATVVVTSSLHGLITADALGVPGAWTLPRPWGEGGAFKFLDYESNFGRTWQRQVPTSAPATRFVEAAATSDRTRVESLRVGLIASLSSLIASEAWNDLPTCPTTALRDHRKRTEYGSTGNQWPTEADASIVVPRGERS